MIALRLSRRLIERLTRLRHESLDLAEHKLPELVEKVRSGADVSVDDSLQLLDHGRDEIGEVAEAFNKAQQTAVSAAVQEAKTREGTNKVFLNIAHRSQVIVHRQLQVLDEAEREQEDPDAAGDALPARPPVHPRAPQRGEPDHPRRRAAGPALAQPGEPRPSSPAARRRRPSTSPASTSRSCRRAR